MYKMKSKVEIFAAIFLFGVISISIISIGEVWGANATTFKEIRENPENAFFAPDGHGTAFFGFIAGIAIYALFVWNFYRFISKRDMLPKFFYSYRQEKKISKLRQGKYLAIYVALFPSIIFVWFTVLAFFIYIIAEGMPLYIAIFVSMTIIAVVRILSYYKEEAAKEVAKMIPYAILSFLLTSVAIYANPNFFTEKELYSLPTTFTANFDEILVAVFLVSIIEFSFRAGFIVKRRFRPVVEKKLEDDIEQELKDITKIHFQKMEDKEKWLEKKLEDNILEFKKIEEKQKEIKSQLDKQKKLSNSK
jgi:hypothetical protein